MAKAIKQLSALDAAFLYGETAEVPMHVGSIAVFRLPDTYTGNFFEEFKAQVCHRMERAPVLRWKLESAPFDIDHPSWVEDEQFNIDRHIFRAALPEPRNLATVERLVGWMHAKLLNRARPLWEFYVFDGLVDNEVAIYSKLHHAAVDGGASAALTQIMYDATPGIVELAPVPVKAPQPEAPKPEPQAAFGAALMRTYMQMWTQPLELMRQAPTFLAAAPPAMRKMLDPRTTLDFLNFSTPATPINKAISSERSYAATSLSFARARAIAKASGGKINDVVLAISSGMLRRYLIGRSALPQRSLTAMVPISLREEGDGNANNQVMAMINTLASDVSDPKERLLTIIRESTKAKEMINPFKPLMPLYTTGSFFGAPIAVQIAAVLYSRSNLADVVPPVANVVISNVVGPRMKLYAVGAELTHVFPVSIASHGLALNITVHSYGDALDFGLTAAANLIPDPRAMADMLTEELETLERAFGIAPPVPAPAPANGHTLSHADAAAAAFAAAESEAQSGHAQPSVVRTAAGMDASL